MGKRIIFEKGFQRKFLEKAQQRANLNWRKFADQLGINKGTLKSYRYEYCSLPYGFFSRMCTLVNFDEEQSISEFNTKIVDEIYNRFTQPLGYPRLNVKKVNIIYSNTNINLNISDVTFSRYDKLKKLKFPTTITSQLAEEVGMQLGDGFLSVRKNEYRLKGNKNEKEYYDKFIKPLFKELFNLDINVREYETTYGFEVCSRALWEFKTKILGIPAGRKTNIRVPDILKINDVKILCALVRGYFDTDGGIYFKSRYGYKNYSPEIQVTSVSKQLISDFKEILDMLGFRVSAYKTKKGYYTLYLRGYENLKKYYELIGWSNPKQRKKVEEWIKNYPEICKKINFRPKLFIKERYISDYERL